MADALIGFLPSPPDAASLYIGSYDPVLVAASFLIAAFASYTALEISGRMRAGAAVRSGWLFIGALAMGGGTWAMHFIGMLAFSLPCGVYYDPVGRRRGAAALARSPERSRLAARFHSAGGGNRPHHPDRRMGA